MRRRLASTAATSRRRPPGRSSSLRAAAAMAGSILSRCLQDGDRDSRRARPPAAQRPGASPDCPACARSATAGVSAASVAACIDAFGRAHRTLLPLRAAGSGGGPGVRQLPGDAALLRRGSRLRRLRRAVGPTRHRVQVPCGDSTWAPVFATAIATAAVASGTPLPSLRPPMPLAAARLRERGYNQAWELARRTGVALRHRHRAGAAPAHPRHAASALAALRAARAGNVRGAFARRAPPARRGRRPLDRASSTTS